MSGKHNSRNNRIGYGKPPPHTRFKRGQSGNPRGRPKKSRQDAVDVISILDKPFTAAKAGRTKKITPFEAAMFALVRKALKDNSLVAALEFIRLCEELDILVPRPRGKSCSVRIVPQNFTTEEFKQMWEKHGPPPWPGERSGLPGD